LIESTTDSSYTECLSQYKLHTKQVWKYEGYIVNDHVYVLTIAETKIDATFPTNQFCMSIYKMYRLDTGRSGVS